MYAGETAEADRPTYMGQPASPGGVGTDGDDVITGTSGKDVIVAVPGTMSSLAATLTDLFPLGDPFNALMGRTAVNDWRPADGSRRRLRWCQPGFIGER